MNQPINRRSLILIPLIIVCFGLLSVAKANPDPGTMFTNHSTADGKNALGTFSLSQPAGDDNSAFGYFALQYMYSSFATGKQNTAVGSQALFSNRTGGDNTAIGFKAL